MNSHAAVDDEKVNAHDRPRRLRLLARRAQSLHLSSLNQLRNVDASLSFSSSLPRTGQILVSYLSMSRVPLLKVSESINIFETNTSF